MCGIVGAISKRDILLVLMNGLKKLEYRGYDSAGVAIIDAKQKIERIRVAGKVKQLEVALKEKSLQGHLGIAHTRWATHGIPSENNAHPFISHQEFALVHNGIIENHSFLREKLEKVGYQFTSETDTEVVVHLIHQHFVKNPDILQAIKAAIAELEGAYALGIITIHQPEKLYAVRKGSPLVIGRGRFENFLASDPLALLSVTEDFIYLEDGDIAEIERTQLQIFATDLKPVKRETHRLTIENDVTERGQYRHFMKKEIMEQPDAILHCLEGRITEEHVLPALFGPNAENIFPKVKSIHLVACGTSYHAAMVAKYWIESLAHISCVVEVASEYRYRDIANGAETLFVVLSQSGETADTLAALRMAKARKYLSTLVICNVPGSTMMREAELHFLTRAGVEIGVASTKAFITQLIALFLLALTLKKFHVPNGEEEKNLVHELNQLSSLAQKVLSKDNEILKWASYFIQQHDAIFIGRNTLFPIALEGALKMKELSYIHAEGYPAGELKHGPLALVDPVLPVIAMAPSNLLLEKTLSNLQEIRARGGQLFVLTDLPEAFKDISFKDAHVVEMPMVSVYFLPILYTLPLQFLAYHVAVLKGTDVDQPRNLAKSVTVE